MTLAVTVALALVLLAALGAALYVVRAAAGLKGHARDLAAELSAFKSGGFRALVKEELAALTAQAEQGRQRILELEQLRTAAVQQFSQQIGSVTSQLASLHELQVRVGELNDLLKPQQLRGELGEVIVRALIADKLPRSHYEEDHTFADGKTVEFAIRLNDKLVPVDSKLQLEDFRRLRDAPEDRRPALRTEFKRRIRQKIDEVASYIRPAEGTYNFALLVIPSEAVYYELVAGKEFVEEGGLYDYARSVNVFPVSPLTFWAYLTAIAQGLHGLQIEQRAEEVLACLQTIGAGVRGFADTEFRVLGEHLINAKKKYDEAKEKLEGVKEDLVTLERFKAEPWSERGVAA